MPDDALAFGRNVIAYGEPGTPRGAFLPIKANHSVKSKFQHKHCKLQQSKWRN